uniref:Uncharacterized protein LOC111127823 isoform X2 n=1 Tax=Crassostrea virginica TaxID=6565 RepID=A0A8B8DM06_CRAVI|nr:uncharacterized protein LOC111127823 isoform X2 [Crassostrea virginica]
MTAQEQTHLRDSVKEVASLENRNIYEQGTTATYLDEMVILDHVSWAGDESILNQGGKECFPSCDLPERYLSKAVLDWTEKRVPYGSFDTWYIAREDEALFPRYKYHLHLIQKIVQHHIRTPVIVLLLNNTEDAEYRAFCSHVTPLRETYSRCIVVVSPQCDSKKLQRSLVANAITKFSIVSPNADVIWNNITSAMELTLIDFLKEKKKTSIPTILEDVETVIRRIERCSEFTDVKTRHKSYDIPEEIKTVLRRFERSIIRYGFFFDRFRLIVREKDYKEIKSLLRTKPDGFPELEVICQGEFKENIVPFCGTRRAQGRHLYPSNLLASETQNDTFGTLGCLAKLNEEKIVALTCYHVCKGGGTVYIENEQKERAVLGTCLFDVQEPLSIQKDFAILEVNKEMEGYLSERKLLDHMGTSTNAEVCLQHNLSLHGEIVHKLGATTRWTDGEIVGAEIIQGMHGLLTVRGMNGDVFGKIGDSGSIVFREMFFGREKKLEVVAMLHSGEFTPQTSELNGDQEQSRPLVVCLVFKDAFEHLKRTNSSTIQSIAFFND